jgi:serine/threonine protein kinase
MRLAPGKPLGPYEITAALGVGGMGEVYRARDTRLDRTVAIKILSQLPSDPGRRQRFEREAKAISGLNHPNICVLHDIGHQDGIDYLVMECVEGETQSTSFVPSNFAFRLTVIGSPSWHQRRMVEVLCGSAR